MDTKCYPSIVEGWDVEREALRKAHDSGRIGKLTTEFSNACSLNCPGCFTVKVDGEEDISSALQKRRLPNEMSAETRLALLDEAVALGVRSVDIVGAGEPMIDPHLRPFVEKASGQGVHVNIFTHGAHRELLDESRVAWWKDHPVSFFIKLWSQNPAVNEAMVKPKGILKDKYTELRDRAIQNLVNAGFCEPTLIDFDGRTHRRTRLGADIMVTRSNFDEIAELFRFCRRMNIMPEIKNFIPQGPSKLAHLSGSFEALPEETRNAMVRERVDLRAMAELRREIDRIDEQEFGNEPLRNIYLGGNFCTQSAGSLYAPINGHIYSCVGTGNDYGAFVPGANTLQTALRQRTEQVGFGCFPRLVESERAGQLVPSEEASILSQK